MKFLRNAALGAVIVSAVMATSALDLPKRTVNGKEYYYYEVPPKETIYSITRKFKVTRDDIIRYNPQVRDGLRAGDVLYFPVEDEAEQPAEPVQTEKEAIMMADTVAIAAAEEPIAEVPAPREDETEEIADEEIVAEETVITAEHIEGATDTIESEEINIAVVLPFMLQAENMTRQTENLTNFYRGLLLAVDSLAPSSGMKVNVIAVDTEGGSDCGALFATRRDLHDADYIITAPDSLAIESIATAADSLDACVLNLFATKNDAYLRHESVFQANIPHDEMYSRAIKAFCDRYAGKHVIILNASDIPAEKASFVEQLTAGLVRAGIPYEQIDFEGKLSDQNLGTLTVDRDYVFVPTSHTRESMMKILPALGDFDTMHPTTRVELFGYPEWVALRGEIKDRLHRLNTTVYSRFSTDLDGVDAATVRNSYRKWYGTDLPVALPNTALLGFDAGAWIINAAQNGITAPFTGVQNSFKTQGLDNSGYINTALYLINFMPSGQLNATVL